MYHGISNGQFSHCSTLLFLDYSVVRFGDLASSSIEEIDPTEKKVYSGVHIYSGLTCIGLLRPIRKRSVDMVTLIIRGTIFPTTLPSEDSDQPVYVCRLDEPGNQFCHTHLLQHVALEVQHPSDGMQIGDFVQTTSKLAQWRFA